MAKRKDPVIFNDLEDLINSNNFQVGDFFIEYKGKDACKIKRVITPKTFKILKEYDDFANADERRTYIEIERGADKYEKEIEKSLKKVKLTKDEKVMAVKIKDMVEDMEELESKNIKCNSVIKTLKDPTEIIRIVMQEKGLV